MTSRNSYILYLAVGLFVAGVGACSPEQTSNNGIVVDTLFTGGDIVTMNDAQPVAEAVAVLDGTIVAVGDLAELEARIESDFDIIDLGGKTLVPGFFDAHGHYSEYPLLAGLPNIA
jgi:cytosine/adenosine deaminase-related metal-dependent hydrolase